MSYSGAVRTRLDEAWGAEIVGPDGLPVGYGESLALMRNRSRNLERNNALASAVLDRACENVIGTGIELRSASKNNRLWNDKVNDYVRRLIHGKLFDVRRMYSFDQIQRLKYRATLRDGDASTVLVDRGFGPEIQLLEGDAIDNPRTGYDRRIQDGVELSADGAPIAYHVNEVNDVGMTTPRRIAARDIIFMHRTTRYNVVRGLPAFHGTYSTFEQIMALLEAAVVAMRVGASQALIVKVKRGTLGTRSTTLNAKGVVVQSRLIEPGMINFIEEGDEVSSFNPQQPGQNFTESIQTFARFVGLKFGLTLERVLLDFSKANYSVSRSTALQEERTAAVEQWDFNLGYFARLWPWMISKGIKSGALDGGPVPDDYFLYDPIVNGRPLVEPSKDAPGLKTLIELGYPPQEVFGRMGLDTNTIIEQQKEWKEKREAAGLQAIGFTVEPAAKALPAPDDKTEESDAAPGR